MTPEPRALKWALNAICIYEATAISTGRIPTITCLLERTDPRVKNTALLTAGILLADHFYFHRIC
jgi:hypothetical protein